MLIPMDELVSRYDLSKIDGVLHVGGHVGEEAPAYEETRRRKDIRGFGRVDWVEANPAVLGELRANVEPYGHRVIHELLTDEDGVMTSFNITNNAQSSSILELGTHKICSPDVHYVGQITLPSMRLDTLVEKYDVQGQHLFGNFDTQGAEGIIFRGGEETLKRMDYLYLEANLDELYVGTTLWPDLRAWLSERGFDELELRLAGDQRRGGANWTGWGDVLLRKRGT